MRIAILGGTFDPPHLGHLILADTVITNCDYDKVIFIPAKIPPHKNISGEASNEDRLNMLKLSIENDERFLLDEYELNNDGVSYTINTLNYLYKNYDIEGKIGLIIGADLVKDFDKWREPEKISEISNITVVNREEDKNLYKENIDKYNIKVIMAPRIDISSSLIRNRIKEKKGFRYFVKEKVYDYILSKNLYL
ncbi:nicotinate (nicotinamide) nucleotide adenylyltransferase [Brachyspira hyodysenteriae]|uniref:nicotinate (nicotinamide) nucleotide adenylyltransferase n=1 Tax=Brachyspira hyodysenteriae TaxID=159 RepID=UPI0022CDB74B|nr:nicotinate (nicotinamide) nucleotide adenylyltransferase [Brachyspira hyodysenteriae]MCZ9878369.1 nicotinate (nicotinamide) nucleotide adenylyltransferase [Brachyspira hyodysenteriae]MCZ9891097.1 nicotinate (nicotinamide) nucleotide adenylyltransferase [Brachyspira hyodysenteriae]MCZ9898030.1 nicotinate (nicotinamide) nucleotide adenylyltransferase [Brachyspira hyodysenteriae]MCZ9960616.1 nicotinate (nicotinamide) nucleotide adenylyltransferase [Brachyspira hyodysenteriae]MCZ9988377.1 nicot